MSDALQRPPRILIVDDDDLIIRSLHSLFVLETDYDVHEFNKPEEALEAVEGRQFDLVISDFLMPRMNGVEFLKRVRELQPDAVRILLTGFADKENAIRAINEVGLYQYLEKPWSNDDLLLLIRNALQSKSLRTQLSQKVTEFERLLKDHRELSHQHKAVQRDLDMAARVQQSLLPSSIPDIDGFRCTGCYEPCTLLGGDFYDYVETPEGLTVVVADVSGHGVQAALTSMLLKASFQEAAINVPGPAELLEEMNGRLLKFLPASMYACATALSIMPGQTKVRLATAGLPYPVVLRASTDRIDELAMSGVPLALLSDAIPDAYDYREIELHKGDVLLVASDGLNEIRGRNDGFFQDGALHDALRELRGKDGCAVIHGLMQSAESFKDGLPFPDDVTIFAVTKT